jgi:hypothetical protein
VLKRKKSKLLVACKLGSKQARFWLAWVEKPSPALFNLMWHSRPRLCSCTFVAQALLPVQLIPYAVISIASEQTKYETTLAQFFCAATKKSAPLCSNG